MRRVRLGFMYLFGLLALAFVVACGGDKVTPMVDTSSTPVIATTPQSFPTPSSALLDSMLLRLDDLDSGWLQEPVQPTGATVAYADFCGKRVESFKPDAVALFGNPSKGRPLMIESISMFEDGAMAQAALARVNEARAGCFDWTSTDGVRRTDWHTESFAHADIGDEAFVEKSTTQLEGLSGRSTSVSVVVRCEDTILSLVEAAVDDLSITETLDIAAKALERYRSAVQQSGRTEIEGGSLGSCRG